MKEIYHNQTYKKYAPQIILEGIRGSQAHGTYVPQHPDSVDDEDLMGVAVMPIDYYVGLNHFEVQEIKEGRYDVVIYEIRKFIRLLLKQNPSVVMLLWLQDHYYTKRTELSELLIKNRDIFSSKKAYQAFSGYAYGQFKRMTHFQAYEGYMGAKRKALVDKYGYDTKNASHLIRLLKMGIEFLSSGQMNVFRHDNEMLIEIKYGKWKLEKVKDEAERLFKLADEAHMNSKLPSEPDYAKANELCERIILEHHKLITVESVNGRVEK